MRRRNRRVIVDTLEFLRKTFTAEDLEVAEKVLAVPAGSYEDYESGLFSWVVGQPIPKDRVDTYSR